MPDNPGGNRERAITVREGGGEVVISVVGNCNIRVLSTADIDRYFLVRVCVDIYAAVSDRIVSF